MSKNIYLFQIASKIDDNWYLPSSIGYLWSYLHSQDDLKNYSLGGLFFKGDSVDESIDLMENPQIVGFSVYMWNFDQSIKLAKQIHNKWPNCKIVLGGPSAPDKEWLIQNDFINAIIFQYGELAFTEYVRGNLEYPGILTKDNNFSSAVPYKDINVIPSPYLTGVFDDIVKDGDNYSAVIESNRGCPYACTFCEQALDVYNKISKFNHERVLDELTWCSENKIINVYIGDSNTGMFKKDVEVFEKFAELHHKNGYPVDAFYSMDKKMNNTNILRIKEIMADFSSTLIYSVQSFSEESLVSVKRKNISTEAVLEIIEKTTKNRVTTELILGLPRESLDTWIKGFDELYKLNEEVLVEVAPLIMIPNTPIASKENIDEYNMIVRDAEHWGFNLSYSKEHRNKIKICIGTDTMSTDEWITCYLYSSVIFSGINNLELVRKMLNKSQLLPSEYYMSLMNYMKDSDGILNELYEISLESVKGFIFEENNWEYNEEGYETGMIEFHNDFVQKNKFAILKEIAIFDKNKKEQK